MIHAFKYTDSLEESGFTSEQAKAAVELWLELMNGNFATKSDLKELEFALKEDMKTLEYTLKEDMKTLEHTLKEEMKTLEYTLKNDMKTLEHTLRDEIKDIRTDMVSLESRLTIKLGSLMALGLGLSAVLQKL